MRSYATHLSLEKHFRLGITITRIERLSPSGPVRWALKLRDKGGGGGESVEIFDRVLLSLLVRDLGHGLSYQGFKGLRDSKGKRCIVRHIRGMCVHTKGSWNIAKKVLRRQEPFVGKQVMVVGLGNMGMDIAVELCGVAKQVYISHRSGSRIVSILFPLKFNLQS